MAAGTSPEKVPLPTVLPGEFFVLERNRFLGTYVIHVDDSVGDEDGSSYDLGSNIQVIMRQFRIWGHGLIGDRAIDFAREFNAVQVIPESDRLIPLIERNLHTNIVLDQLTERGEMENPGYVSLPRLRASE